MDWAPLNNLWWKYSVSKTSGLNSTVQSTDIDWRSQNLRHFYPSMGLRLGYSGFSRDQNNRYSSGAYILWYEREDEHA